MQQHTQKNTLDVSGKMTPEDAGKVGMALADAARRLAIGGVLFIACCGVAVVIRAIRWW